MPSGPSDCGVAGAAIVFAGAATVVPGAVGVAAARVVLELVWLLEPPHADSAAAMRRDAKVGIRLRVIHTMVSCARMTESAASAALPMTTALELPGVRISENLGVCYGLVARSMGLVGGVTSGFRALRRGEIPEYTQLMEDSRRHAIDRMAENARLLGADAIIAVRFDSSEIGGQYTEIVAYGTAVKVEPVS
jgi:uncharacterized protein YbjQ (UPF0145 family)